MHTAYCLNPDSELGRQWAEQHAGQLDMVRFGVLQPPRSHICMRSDPCPPLARRSCTGNGSFRCSGSWPGCATSSVTAGSRRPVRCRLSCRRGHPVHACPRCRPPLSLPFVLTPAGRSVQRDAGSGTRPEDCRPAQRHQLHPAVRQGSGGGRRGVLHPARVAGAVPAALGAAQSGAPRRLCTRPHLSELHLLAHLLTHTARSPRRSGTRSCRRCWARTRRSRRASRSPECTSTSKGRISATWPA